MGKGSVSPKLGLAALREESGSVLLEAAFGVSLILTVALPFASLVNYATYAARDLNSVQAAARDSARSERALSVDPLVTITCGASPNSVDGLCVAPLARGTYVAASKDTVVALPFGLELHTNTHGVARVD